MRRTGLAAAMGLALLALALAQSGPGQGHMKLLSGFEWEEFAGKLGRWDYIGKPYLKAPDVGWKGERIEKLDEVGPEGFQLIDGSPSSSRHYPRTLCVPQHATQGKFAFRFLPHGIEMSSWSALEKALAVKHPPPWPATEPGYDAHDHWFQRMAQVYKQAWPELADWSGFERLRFDVTSVGQPIKLGFRVRDGSGPRINPGFTGLRSGLVTFTVPADETVTCDLPLAELLAVGELEPKRIHRYNIRINGLPAGKAPTDLFLDNIRLVAKDGEPKPPLKLIAPDAPVGPFARPVWAKPPTVRNAEKLNRRVEPVEPLGPVVINPNALYAGRLGHNAGHFGASGATYFSNSRRAVVAYDSDRLVVVIGGQDKQPKSRDGAPRGGTLAMASFDGGRTWGGLRPEDKDFTVLPWFLRSNFSADRFGHVYAVGTPNCDSYQEGQDICLHRLAFTGETWLDDRMAIIHQDGYKCPHTCGAMATESGRIWAAWGDGFGGYLARYSDDDGFTWPPCKDASAKPPRPFYQPRLADALKPDAPAPPKEVLLWPSESVVGSMLTPYRDHVAVFNNDGSSWAFHDGTKWSEPQKGAKIGGLLTVTTLGADRVFLCRGAQYDNTGGEKLADLVVADLRDPAKGVWHTEKLEDANVASAIVTVSGEAVFCFYVLKVADDSYEIRYRRFKGDTWGPSVRLAAEQRRINHLAAPQICPATYAAILWDQHFRNAADASEVKFCRVPNK